MKQNSRGVPRDTDRMMMMLLVLLVVVVGQTDGGTDGRQTQTGEISEIPSSPKLEVAAVCA